MTMLNGQISAMQTLYAQQQQDMEQQWATVEATLSRLQSQSSAFSSSVNASNSARSSTVIGLRKPIAPALKLVRLRPIT